MFTSLKTFHVIGVSSQRKMNTITGITPPSTLETEKATLLLSPGVDSTFHDFYGSHKRTHPVLNIPLQSDLLYASFIYIYIYEVHTISFHTFFVRALLLIVHTWNSSPLRSYLLRLVVPFQQLLEGPMEVLLCECVNDLRHSLFHLLSSLKTTASELRE